MRKWPIGILDTLDLFIKTVFVKRKQGQSHNRQTLGEFGEIYLGKAATENFFCPMTNGIFAAQAYDLSLKLTFPQLIPEEGDSLFKRIKQIRRMKERGATMSAALNGTGEITVKLFEYLNKNENCEFYFKQQVKRLDFEQNNIVTCPAYIATNLFDARLSELLQKVEYLPLVTATVFVKNSDFKKVPEGVGVLNSPSSNRESLGILFNSGSFDGRVKNNEYSSFTVILGGNDKPKMVEKSEDELKEIITKEVQEILSYNGDPEDIIITCWPKAIPYYSLEHEEILDELPKHIPERTILFGNYTGNIGIRNMIDKIFDSKAGLG
jgi:oxygen-dependent protoporphyrinogen oxidase